MNAIHVSAEARHAIEQINTARRTMDELGLLPNGKPKYLDVEGHLHGGLVGSLHGTATLAFPERSTSREQMHAFIVDQIMAATDDEAMAAVRCYIKRNGLGCGTFPS